MLYVREIQGSKTIFFVTFRNCIPNFNTTKITSPKISLDVNFINDITRRLI